MSSPARPLYAGIPGAPTLFTRLRVLLIVAIILFLYLWSARGTDFSLGKMAAGAPQMGNLLLRMLPYEPVKDANFDVVGWTWRSDLAWKQLQFFAKTWDPLQETLRIAIASATFGVLLAIPSSLMAARNLARYGWLYWSVRGFLNLLRTMPDLVLAAIFAGALGVGALPGVLALTLFSWAIMAKLLSESVESIDPGPVEALRATGANRLQIIRYAVMPQVMPQLTSYALYVFELDVRVSFVLGFVGAGGIGHLLRTELNFLHFREVFVVIVVTLAVVLLIDYLSNYLRERLL